MKEYPLDVTYCVEFDGHITTDYHSKGHHEADKFIAELRSDYEYQGNVENVRHLYGKLTPSPDGRMMMMNYKSKPCKGSFPVTVIEL